MRFRNSLSDSSLLTLVLISDFNENNAAFLKSLQSIDFPLNNELSGILTEWTLKITDSILTASNLNEDPKKEKYRKRVRF
ncbi:hypothetical protein LEP1GSC043_4255 [Leptospira weilii str. Ecochallenge]|uniref:Uncharacterized protein n=1 Tax=Leptospira weilii str. Ecochallenge TaxID=1049986 RepID=N1UHT5_9LEPT|nr:hypothetical protein LEP1GSC043_4255 [Leptospira weilii str. Ecochallenge]